jgi:hypothetical protein
MIVGSVVTRIDDGGCSLAVRMLEC